MATRREAKTAGGRCYSVCRTLLLLLLASPVCVTGPVSAGMFQTKCLERHFWLSVEARFLGRMVRIDFEDQHGLHLLSNQEAALCGYTVLIDDTGDLVFRASFLACHVHSESGSDYHLRLRLVNLQADGEAAAFPLQLRCSLPGRWSPREMVCEENYMEVSIQQPLVSFNSQNEKVDLAVTFHSDDQPPEAARVFSPMEAAALGYHVSRRGPHLVLRCPYSSPHSRSVQEEGVDLEIVRASVMYRRRDAVQAVDATVACALSGATADGSDLVWAVPYFLSPLVRGRFRGRGVSVGLSGRPLSESESKQRGISVRLQPGRAELRIPLGANGGRVKSGVVRGRYGQSASLDAFLVRRWEDERSPLTQHRSFRLLRTPLVPRPLVLANSSVSPDGFLSVTFGPFAADVSLQKATVDGGGELLAWTPTRSDEDLRVSKVSHGNGSHSYRLSFPLHHPKIIPEYVGGGFETYGLSFSFILHILPGGEVFYHEAVMEHSVEHTAPSSPRLEGKCTDSSLVVLLHHGAHAELQWELFLGAHRLDWDLLEMGEFRVEVEDEYLSVEIPSYSPGTNYVALTLRGLVSEVEVSVVDAASLKVEDRLVHRCTFPVRELLACLPGGRMVAVVDTTHTVPPTRPNRTTLLDPSCVPTETDSARALFSFGPDSCGTAVTTDGDFLVYENQISYRQEFLPQDEPLIHRDSPYRLTLQCRYPANETRALAMQRPLNSSLAQSSKTQVRKWRVNLDRQQNRRCFEM